MHLSNHKSPVSIIVSIVLSLSLSVSFNSVYAQVSKPKGAAGSNWQASLRRMYLFTDIEDSYENLEYTQEGKFSIRSIASNKVVFTGENINIDNSAGRLTGNWIYIIDPAGEKKESHVEEVTALASAEVKSLTKDFSVYPNPVDPSSREITLGLEDFEDGKEIQMSLVDGHGRVIGQKSFTIENKKQAVAIPQLPSGMYFVTINENENRYAKKFLIK